LFFPDTSKLLSFILLKGAGRRSRHGYWRIYLRSRKRELRMVVEATGRLLKDPPDPWTRPKRGRPYKYQVKEIVILCVLKAYFDMSYLDLENLAPIRHISRRQHDVEDGRLGEDYCLLPG